MKGLTDEQLERIPEEVRDKLPEQIPEPLGVLTMIVEDEFEDKTKGGVYLPSVSKETQFLVTGTVIAKGKGMWNAQVGEYEPPPVDPGDKVLFIKVQSHMWRDKSTGQTYWFINMGNLIAKI